MAAAPLCAGPDPRPVKPTFTLPRGACDTHFHIFGPMARTYAYALAGGLLATFTVTPALSALVNATVDALAEFGVRDIKMPVTPYAVWRAIQQARR